MKKKILIGIGLLFLAIIFISAFVFLEKFDEIFKTDEIDMTLVFDAKYYAACNLDLKDTVGNNEEDLFNHFMNKGMKEGRRASFNFDVNYYKDHNDDLVKIFGNNNQMYYEHYAQYGRKEGRQGSIDDISKDIYDVSLDVELSNDYTLKANLGFEREYQFKYFYLIELPVYENDLEKGSVIHSGLMKERIIVNNYRLTNKYVICLRENGKFKQVSNYAYIINPGVSCKVKNLSLTSLDMQSKKGLAVTNQNSNISFIEELSPSIVSMDLFIDEFVVLDFANASSENVLTYDYNGNTYYFNKSKVEEFDADIKYYNDLGYQVVCNILLKRNENLKELYYENALDKDAIYYAIDISKEFSERNFEGFLAFVSSRYNGATPSKPVIRRWVIGNRVNMSSSYNYMGNKTINDYTQEYLETYRIAYNVIKSNNWISKVYISLDKWWENTTENDFTAREFISCFNSKIRDSGNIDWNLAYYVSEYPEDDPNYLDDFNATEENRLVLNNFDTNVITMNNLNVLTEYLKQGVMLNPQGYSRSVIVIGNGITSYSEKYGISERMQAASLLYSYYKTALNDNVEGYIYPVISDDNAFIESNPTKQFGLIYEGGTSMVTKLAFDVYKQMDIKDTVNVLGYLSKVLDSNSSSFSELIPEFDEELFNYNLSTNKEYRPEAKISLNVLNINFANGNSDFEFTGAGIEPELIININDNYLTKDVDYEAIYSNNINQGMATITLIGKGNYAGVREIRFNIH